MTSPANTSGNTFVPQYINYELDEQELRMQLTRRDTQLSVALNTKENGVVETIETQNGQRWFSATTNQNNKRFGFRKAFVVPAIAAGATATAAHGLTGITIVTHIFGGVVTDVPDFRALGHASVTANANIEVIITPTNWVINNGAGGPNITSGILVIEYLYQ